MKLLKCKLANAEPGEKLLKKRGFHGYERGGGLKVGKLLYMFLFNIAGNLGDNRVSKWRGVRLTVDC